MPSSILENSFLLNLVFPDEAVLDNLFVASNDYVVVTSKRLVLFNDNVPIDSKEFMDFKYINKDKNKLYLLMDEGVMVLDFKLNILEKKPFDTQGLEKIYVCDNKIILYGKNSYCEYKKEGMGNIERTKENIIDVKSKGEDVYIIFENDVKKI